MEEQMVEYIKQLRTEANGLLSDTFVSVSEVVRNEIMPARLNKIASGIRSGIDDHQIQMIVSKVIHTKPPSGGFFL